ncbi:hypothetical protein HPB50_012101 [Hyalomma asiaticum]|uniref:Uncharacterized protein n=1 Tax=Hyalomma asiaticum TaxID=266040 RepID=A0ACB7RYV9_HYAAI|nr:hypothetical protein HPB50_012101 [Hyalomma asiaticum]
MWEAGAELTGPMKKCKSAGAQGFISGPVALYKTGRRSCTSVLYSSPCLLVLLSLAVCRAEQPAIPAGKRTQYLVQDNAGGSYKFGYDTGAEQQNFRQEERTSDGTVHGRYGFTDANGYLRVIEYIADETGYHVIHTKTELPQNRPRSTVKPHAPFLGPLPPFIPRPHPDEET